MKDLIKVRIDKASDDSLYSNQIGSEIKVHEYSKKHYALAEDDEQEVKYCIRKSDCTVLSDNTEHGWVPQVGEWVVLIEGYADLEVGKAYQILKPQDPRGKAYIINHSNDHNYLAPPVKHLCKALPHEIPAPEPKGYCIKRTPENAEVLNRWINSLDENKDVDTKFRNDSPIYFYSESVSFGAYSNCGNRQALEGFTELHTVEEFFSKVGYIPENVINVHPNNEKKVKEFFESKVKLTEPKVPSIQETEERIPFDLEKWNTGKFDVVQRNGLPAEILKTNLKSDECIVYITNNGNGFEEICTCFGNGLQYLNDKLNDDLFMIPKTETVWKAIYEDKVSYNTPSFCEEASIQFANSNNLKFSHSIEVTRPIQ